MTAHSCEILYYILPSVGFEMLARLAVLVWTSSNSGMKLALKI